MPVNPYSPSSETLDTFDRRTIERDLAQRWLRRMLLVLLIPALYNYIEFDLIAISASRLPAKLAVITRLVNVTGFLVGAIVIWFYGLSILEFIAGLIRRLFASRIDSRVWNAVLYNSLPLAFRLSIAGAGLWIVWVVGFYRLDLPFLLISWPVGILAHILAAVWYITLCIRWYQVSVADR